MDTLAVKRVQSVFCISSLSRPCEKAIYNRTINFCGYLRHSSSDRLLQIIYDELNRRGNLPRSCPMQTGHYGFNTSFTSFRLPTFLPESSFRLDLNFYRAPEMTPTMMVWKSVSERKDGSWICRKETLENSYQLGLIGHLDGMRPKRRISL
uniref:Uncharacterized protein n=1 Tax=Anopheles atroparvus TaxID=41427 RepID=A0A182JE98_ANOAO